jgi:hypothetical protein
VGVLVRESWSEGNAMTVPARALDKLRTVKRLFARRANVPKPEAWRKWSENDIWHAVIVQVIVVGRAEPGKRFRSSRELKRKTGFRRLARLPEAKIRKQINSALREVGARYASADPATCRKTKALCHNLRVLARTKGGPRGFIRRYLASITGRNADRRRIKYVMKALKYFKSKSARDFLMKLGLVTEAIALDVRIQNVLKRVGIRVPKGVGGEEVYDRFERSLLDGVCKPLKMTGVHFDRMLFQNYESVLSEIG